jgi:hypothetical protein
LVESLDGEQRFAGNGKFPIRKKILLMDLNPRNNQLMFSRRQLSASTAASGIE